MNRRRFLRLASMTPLIALAPREAAAWDAPPGSWNYRRLLVLIELRGGNDGYNTLVPYADPAYYASRPTLAIARDQVIQLSDRAGLHPALAPLLPLWHGNELALLQGLGYPAPNLSHFRSIEIWDRASSSDQYLREGWLARAFATAPAPRKFAAEGVVVGSRDLGPLTGGGLRVLALSNAERSPPLAKPAPRENRTPPPNAAFAHLLKGEPDTFQATTRLEPGHAFATAFPESAFGAGLETAARIAANPCGVAVVRLSLNGFDTHCAQRPTHARLLGDLADGLVALRRALTALGTWNDTLVMTYSEFGRRPRENLSAGTDHGTSNVHFVLGGRVRGGIHGDAPSLARLNGDGNAVHTVDFRSLYATVLDDWWGVPSVKVLGGRFAPLPMLRS